MPGIKRLAKALIRERAYPTWAAAVHAARGSYTDDLVNDFRIARAKGRKSGTGEAINGTVLPLLIRALGRDDLEITDFGGATGEIGFDYVAAHPKGRYTVVENATLVRHMSGHRVSFTSQIPDHCDVFYSSSTLQYMDDPDVVLKKAFKSARDAVVLVRNSFANKVTFHVQKSQLFENGNGPLPSGFSDRTIRYPHRTIVEESIHKIAREHGFTCVARLEEESGARHGAYGKQLVFLRSR